MDSSPKLGLRIRPSSSLVSLPPELLDRVLEYAYDISFLRLWASGDVSLRTKLNNCSVCLLEWDGAHPLSFPSFVLRRAFQLKWLRLSYSEMIAHFPMPDFRVKKLPQALHRLDLNFSGSFDKLAHLGAHCASLTSLSVHSSSPSHFPPLKAFPPTLTSLELSAPRVLDSASVPDLALLLSSLPSLLTFSVRSLRCTLDSGIEFWPPYLQSFTASVCLSDHSLFGAFPLTLRLLDIELHPRASDSHGSYLIDTSAPFPWSQLPQGLVVLRYKGWTSSRPETLPAQLKVFSYEQVPNLLFGARPLSLEEIMSVRQWYWKNAPPHLEECKLRICTGAQRIRVSEIPLLPPSLTVLDIAPSIQEQHFPMISHRVLKLVLNGVSTHVCSLSGVQLPPSLTSLTLNASLPRNLLCWKLPDSLTDFYAPDVYFHEKIGALALPRALRSLCCSSTSLPSSFGIEHLPESLTDLTLVMGVGIIATSKIPGVPKNKYPDLILQGSAERLPPNLRHLKIQQMKDRIVETPSTEVLDVAQFLGSIHSKLPLSTLAVTDYFNVTMSDTAVFSKLPSTLQELKLPVSKATASLFQSLPRSLRVLLLARTDTSFENATVSQMSMLPSGLVSLCIRGYPASVKDIAELRPNLQRVVV